MDMVDYMSIFTGILFIFNGILSLVFALYALYKIISSIFQSYKDGEELGQAGIFAWIFPLVISATMAYAALNFTYYYCIEVPKQRELEAKEKQAEEEAREKEEEAFREYVRENGEFEYEESELTVIHKDMDTKCNRRGRYRSSRTEYIVTLKDDSEEIYEVDSYSLYYEVEIGDTVIKTKSRVIDKNNGDILEINDPYYSKKESDI